VNNFILTQNGSEVVRRFLSYAGPYPLTYTIAHPIKPKWKASIIPARVWRETKITINLIYAKLTTRLHILTSLRVSRV